MTTTTTKVETKWDAKKTAERNASILAATWVSAYEVISKLDQKAVQEFQDKLTQHKLNYYKTLNIKTPMDLVKAIGETEHNVFGSEMEIHGDDKKATLKYLSCGMWNASEKLCAGKLSQEDEQKMGEQCAASWSKIGKEFGFNFEPKMSKDFWELTFSK
jgi:hypothetical protein